MVPIKVRLDNDDHYDGGNNIQYIVIHGTGNNTDTDEGNANYFCTGSRSASAHYFVDDDSITQVVKDSDGSWHCGDGAGKYGITNRNSLGIEMCCTNYGYSAATQANTIDLVVMKMKQYNVPFDRVVRHYDASRKNCPSGFSANNWAAWFAWKNKLQAALGGNSTPAPSTSNLYRVRKSWDDVKSQIGAFSVLQNAIDLAKSNAGYIVYDSNGKQVYPEATQPAPTPTHLYRVRKTWDDVKGQVGAYSVLDNAKKTADENPGYKVFDENGNVVYTPTTNTEPTNPPVVTPPTPDPDPDPEPVVVKHPVMGNAEITIEQAETFLHKTNPDAPYYAAIYKAEAEKEGVRWDIAFAQSILETGYFKSNYAVNYNNFSGLGVTGASNGTVEKVFVEGVTEIFNADNQAVAIKFSTPELGIRCQIQHLKAYASTDALNGTLIDPRFKYVTRGKAPNIEDFGNGVWAASTDNYGGRIYQIFESMKATVGEPIPEPKPDEPKPDPEPTPDDSIDLTPETVSAFKIVIQFIIDFIKKILSKK